jgi:CRISPR-associated endonuclease Csn1
MEPKHIWGFDFGKASLGEAVQKRDEKGVSFPQKTAWLMPADFARRGPASKSGTPASRHRALKTREARKDRAEWLQEIWDAAGLPVLRGRSHAKTNGKWRLNPETDAQREMRAQLEREFAEAGDNTCYTSCLLRIQLLRWQSGNPALREWQIYKALWSAVQKRGYSDVPWKESAAKEKAPAADEEAAYAAAHQRWREFVEILSVAKLGEHYQYPCYYDALHLKLWSPEEPDKAQPWDGRLRPSSTRQVVFPGSAVERELLRLAGNAAAQLPQLEKIAYAKIMEAHRSRVRERVAHINAQRALKGKKLIHVPPLQKGAQSFAELFVYGVGGKPNIPAHKRPIASWDPQLRKEMGLKLGSPDDRKAAVGQVVAKFENRMLAECALIGRSKFRPKGLAVCRNTSADDFAKAEGDEDERLLPAQVTFLMKLKNMRVEEKTPDRKQQGLTPEQLSQMFAELNKKRKYHLTQTEWARWCERFNVLPVTQANEKTKGAPAAAESDAKEDKGHAVEKPSTEGRCRFSRPALRILKSLLLSGKAPSAFRDRLVRREATLLTKLGPQPDRSLQVFDETGDQKQDGDNSRKGLLISDLDFLLKMRKDGAPQDSWDGIFIPSRNLDRLAAEAEVTKEERYAAIQQLVGQQNNPIVRHRLTTFWNRLIALESRFGVPDRIVIELVRDDPESSWLGAKAKDRIKKSQDENRDARDRAKARLTEMKAEINERNVRKFMLWEAQGGQCLYGQEVPDAKGESKARCQYTDTALPFTKLESYRIDHIVPRALGGPDSFQNLILTTEDTNARKGDRTPYQWFRQDRTEEQWIAYRTRVFARAKDFGFKKVRLLLGADAHELVGKYTPLAETGWIARLAQVIAGLHFGWSNGIDANGIRRVTTVSGGLTGRVRRAYYLNSLTGPRSNQPLPNEKADRRLLEREAEGDRASKNRRDHRHHALDAMVLTFLEGWVNDPNREDEFRFTELGDRPCYLSAVMRQVFAIKERIEQLQKQFKESREPSQREEIQIQITRCRDQVSELRERREWRVVRNYFHEQLEGAKEKNITQVLPLWLHYPKSRLEAMLYRGVWLPVESEPKVARATVDNYDEAFEEIKLPLAKLTYRVNPESKNEEYSVEHGMRHASVLVHQRGFDATRLHHLLRAFLKTRPTEKQWIAFCDNGEAGECFAEKKGTSSEKRVVVYKLAEKRTKRSKLVELGMSKDEIPDFDETHFEVQLRRLVVLPEKPKGKARGRKSATNEPLVLAPHTELQTKLDDLRLRIESFYKTSPAHLGNRPRKDSERAAFAKAKSSRIRRKQPSSKRLDGSFQNGVSPHGCRKPD